MASFRGLVATTAGILSLPFTWVWSRMSTKVRIISVTFAILIAVFEQVSPIHWLALTMYYEARSEGIAGRYAVANVVLNRVADPRWPNTVRQVVHGGLNRGGSCDFTYMCDGTVHNPWSRRQNWLPWMGIRLEAFGIYMLNLLALRYDNTGHAVFYKRSDTASPWFKKKIASSKMHRTRQIGAHEFFR